MEMRINHAHYGWFVGFYNNKPIWHKNKLAAKTYENKYTKEAVSDMRKLERLGLAVIITRRL